MDIIHPQKQNIIEEIAGIKVADPYRWLEDSTSKDVATWIDLHNQQTHKELKNSNFENFSQELARHFKVTAFSAPDFIKGKYFYTERQPGEDQSVLYVKNGLSGKPTKLFDPNGKVNGNTVTIDYWFASKTGKYIIYGISEGGDEMSTLYIKDVETNKELEEKIIHCRYSSIQWLPDDSAFFYTRNPRPGTVPKNEEHMHTKVFLHKIGENPENDELIFGEGRPKDDMISLGISPDGKLLSIQVSQTWTKSEIYIYQRDTKKLIPLVVGFQARFSLRMLRDKVLLDTDYKANNYRILWSSYEDMSKPLDEWKEFIPEREFVLQTFRVTQSRILVEYLVNACSEVCIFDYDGKEIGKIPLPQYSSLAGITARRDAEEFFYGVDSFVFPKIVYRYDPLNDSYAEYQKMDNPINPDEYEVRQEWYVSKDGTQVPMFIVYKKGLLKNGLNPTVLYGYGGFNSNELPAFAQGWVPWLKRGGIFAVANIRGGGEFGDKWHKGGIKENKQNSFDDFIAAAEHLITQKYTSTKHLGILGGSNGGLLVSAVGTQRPDLCSAVCSRVPLTDMVRFSKFGIAVRWIHEYGNPEVHEELQKILTWSPYHNVKDDTRYPDFFFMTANKDTRVDPLHARKMAAMIQGSNEENKVFVYTEMDAGHGPGKPITKRVESQALVLSFFAKKLGLEV